MYLIIGIATTVVAFVAGLTIGYSLAISYMTVEIEDLDFCPHDYDPDYCPDCRH